MQIDNYKYIPILALKPAEMAALEELPLKDKALILPLIPLKKWANSKSFIKSLERIHKSIGENYWISDIDKEYLASAKLKASLNDDVVSSEFLTLADPTNGYDNWIEFVKTQKNIIPSIQFGNLDELEVQLNKLMHLEKPLAARFELTGEYGIAPPDFRRAIKILSQKTFPYGLLVILDYGDFDRRNLIEYYNYSNLIKQIHSLMPNSFYCVSGTSFPYSFAGSYRGELPIYERLIYNKLIIHCPDVSLIYSDRGSARAISSSGGSGTPPPRIDYPLKNDWRFIRKELDSDFYEKEDLYQEAAAEMLKTDYWIKDLFLWGTQMIEKTSLGDPYGITSANRATAVRINIHLYQQLHYDDILSNLDTDEEWID